MPNWNNERLGALMQAYVRTKWAGTPDPEEALPAGAALGEDIAERIDVLGFDSEKLLRVEPAEVTDLLQRLEREAAKEDSRVQAIALKVRAKEESFINGATAPPGPTRRVSRNGKRPPNGKGRRRRTNRA